MRYTKIYGSAGDRTMIQVFEGYNHNLIIEEGEAHDMRNMTSDHFPAMSPRKKRGLYNSYPTVTGQTEHKINGFVYKDGPIYVDHEYLYVNGYKIEDMRLTDTKKQLISMGAYLIILPDKKWINTANIAEHGDIEASYTSTSNVRFSPCRIDGTDYANAIISDEAPQDPANGQLWVDTTQTPHSLKQWIEASSMWSGIATTYIKISAPGIASFFKQYDGVEIDGIGEAIGQLSEFNGKTIVLWDAHRDEESDGAADYVLTTGFIDEPMVQSEPITIRRFMPYMDFVIESGNRLWGCRYGANHKGEVVNEIYASKLGDFKNWWCYMGLSTDSYAASCGTDGQWTGAVSHLGYPLFFKENCLHKVYGSYPAQYQIQTTNCRGVMKGCGESIATVNESVYYKSRNGVCVYNGSLPEEISDAFGMIRYSGLDHSEGYDPLRCGAVAGVLGQKYYISMLSEEDDQWYLFVYDARLNNWYKEDNLRVDSFCAQEGELWYVDHDTKLIGSINGSGDLAEDDIEWMWETGMIATDSPDMKWITKLTLRMNMQIGSSVSIFVEYDSDGDWHHVGTVNGTSTRSFSLPIRPKRCDHFCIRLEGRGNVKVLGVSKIVENGSDQS